LVVLGREEKLSDLPECVSIKDSKAFDSISRSLDYTPETKLLVVGEENVVDNPKDPLARECLVIREFARALYFVCGTRTIDPNWNDRGRDVQQYEMRVTRLDTQFDEKLKRYFEGSIGKGLWKGTAAVHDRAEYWAEGVVAYFDAAGQVPAPNDAAHPISTREALKEYDADLYDLVNETMAYDGHVDWRYHQ